jgi:hypothetical protein
MVPSVEHLKLALVGIRKVSAWPGSATGANTAGGPIVDRYTIDIPGPDDAGLGRIGGFCRAGLGSGGGGGETAAPARSTRRDP